MLSFNYSIFIHSTSHFFSLTGSGAISAFAIGFITLHFPPQFATALLFFYFSSTFLTKLSLRARGLQPVKHARNHWQVLATAGPPTLALLLLPHDPVWPLYFAYYACGNGDTWASEVGSCGKHILPKSYKFLARPYLVTSLKACPVGTNGGISILGTVASSLGGMALGAACSLALPQPSFGSFLNLSAWGAVIGSLGSFIDSVLGALLQISYAQKSGKRIAGRDILSNEQVNLVSSLLTCVFVHFWK